MTMLKANDRSLFILFKFKRGIFIRQKRKKLPRFVVRSFNDKLNESTEVLKAGPFWCVIMHIV